MKSLLVFWVACLFSFHMEAQQKAFRASDTRMKVYAGDTVSILVDSAHIVSTAQAQLLNEKLLALQQAQRLNQALYASKTELIAQVAEIEAQVVRLLDRLHSDQQIMEEHLVLLVQELDQSIELLQQNNATLSQTNEQLEAQLQQMSTTLTLLKQENRRMSWRNTLSKVLIGLAGLGVGLLVGGR